MNHRSHDLELKKLLDQTSWAARLARTLVGPEGADDLLQETWVQTLAHPPAETLESPRAWLATLLRRGAARMRRTTGRRADRERQAAREEALPSTHALRAREEDRRILVEAVLDLPEAMREPLVLRYFEELEPGQIAERLGLPASTVRTRLQRGLAALRERLEREQGKDWRVWCLALAPAGAGGTVEKAMAGKVTLVLLALAAAALLLVGLWPSGGDAVNERESVELAGLHPGVDSGRSEEPSSPTAAGQDDREAVESDEPRDAEAATLSTDPGIYVIRGLCLDEAKQPVAGLRVVAADLFGNPSAVSGTDGRFVLPLTAPSPLAGPWQSEPIEARADRATLLFTGERHRASARVQLEADREVDVGVVEAITAPHSVCGRVLTASGLPAGGASVYLLRDFELAPSEAAIFRCAVYGRMVIPVSAFGFFETDSDGRFQLQGVPDDSFRLSIYSNGHDGLFTESLEPEEGRRLELGNLQLEPCEPDRSLSGRIVTASGDAVPGAWIYTRCEMSDGFAAMKGPPLVADADGLFQVPVPTGASCSLRVESPRGSGAVEEVEAGADGLTIVVAPAPEAEPVEQSEMEPVGELMGLGYVGGASAPSVPCAGRVTQGGRGVSGARIACWKVLESGGRPARVSHHASAESGIGGRFEISTPASGPFSLQADAGPWNEPLFAVWGPIEREPDEVGSDALLELRPAGSIAGELVGAGARGKVGTTVYARGEGLPGRTTTVGAANEFRFDSLPPGRYHLTRESVPRSGNETADEVVAEVESGVVSQVHFDLSGEITCRLVGRIAFDGKRPRGLSDVRILHEGGSPSPSVDREGNFVVESLRPGRLAWHAICHANPPSYFYQGELDIVGGENRAGADLPTGRLDLEGLPLPDDPEPLNQAGFTTCLTWEGSDGLKWAAYLTQAKRGALTVKQVPAGTIQLHHRPEPTQSPEQAPVVAEIEVRVGETARLAFPKVR